MKRICLLIFTLVALTAITLQARERTLLNFGWRFFHADTIGAEKPLFDDSKWATVDLPHDASIAGPFQKGHGGTVRNGFRTLGRGWYRRHIAYDGKREGKRVLITFEGVYRLATVYINGQICDPSRKNGYLDFEYDITDKLHVGDNVIAVRYDNSYAKSSRWYNGEGINRNVWLTIVDPVHVDRYGTYITTPEVSKSEALVRIETSVKNDGKDSVLCALINDIVDPQGNVVASRKAVAPFAAGEVYTFQQEIPVRKPQLWEVGEGLMYKAVSRVSALPYDGQVANHNPQSSNLKPQTDMYVTPFGIRALRFYPDSGLSVNGRRVYVNGVCLHTDLGPLGTASFDEAWNQRLSAVVDSLGCNAIRLSHNAYPGYVLDWADRHGVLVFDEMLDKWNDSYYGKGADFCDDMLADMRTWIKRDRNHPSVFIWGVGNEVYEQIRDDMTQKNGVQRLKALVDLVNSVDPTRKTTVGQYPNRYSSKSRKSKDFLTLEPHPFEFYADVVSTNYLEKFWDRDHAKYPQLIFMESEMAVGDLGYDFFNFNHGYPVGQFYWGGTDYIGESLGWPAKGWTRGLIDFTNRLKPLGQSVKSFYTTKPMTKIVTRPHGGAGSRVWNDLKMTWIPLEEHWNYKDGDTVTVQVMSNCAKTELILNGNNLGEKLLPSKDKAPELTWEVPYSKGKLEAIGYDAHGNIVSRDVLATAVEPDRVVAKVSKDTMSADGLDLAYIDYTVLDKNGNVSQTPVKLAFSVSEAATIAAQASGDMLSDEPWQNHSMRNGGREASRTTYNGRCQLILRAGRTPGKVKVTAKAKGLKPNKLELCVK